MATSGGGKADLIYGATGTYKTSQIGQAALYILDKYGKKTRLVSADGGGWAPIQSLVDAGIVEVWPIRNRQYVIESIDKACQGWWPLDPADPMSEIVSPLDARCKLRDIGMIAYEGLTSFGSAIMGKLKTPGVQLSQDPNYVLRDGQTDYAGGSLAAFGFVQDRVYDFVMKTHMIPVIEKVLWTALEAKGEEQGTKIPIFGPDIEGKKATGKAGQWFGNMFHMEAGQTEVGVDTESKTLSLKTQVYMYFKNHADPVSRIVFPAKIRAPFQLADRVPERVAVTLGSLNAEGKPVPVQDLKKVYAWLDKLKAEADKTITGGPKPPDDKPEQPQKGVQ